MISTERDGDPIHIVGVVEKEEAPRMTCPVKKSGCLGEECMAWRSVGKLMIPTDISEEDAFCTSLSGGYCGLVGKPFSGHPGEIRRMWMSAVDRRVAAVLAVLLITSVLLAVFWANVAVAAPLDQEMECLALTVYHEARGEPVEGRVAVAYVAVNRARHPHYPDTICGTVLQGGERRHRCQFSWYCDGKSDAPKDRQAWADALAVSALVLMGMEDDPTYGSIFYHSVSVAPSWADTRSYVGRIGRHEFYL